MANYVKFRRGTPEQFAALQTKNDDTLYFILNGDSDVKLYLGAQLIACGKTDGATALKDLEDITLNSVANKDLLVYENGVWVNKTISAAIGVMVGATEGSAGVSGLVPAPVAGAAERYLRADGQWVAIKATITEVVNDDAKEHSAIMETVANPAIGDILIIEDKIGTTGKYQYTSYVYGENGWAAMDGNYNADNVYFDEDFLYTAAIGAVAAPAGGSGMLAADGKSMKQFIASLLAKEENPVTAQPSVSVKLTNSGTYEVGTSVTPAYSVSFSKGSYTYGPDTGITATYAVSDSNGEASTATSGNLAAFTVGTSTSYKVSVTASWEDGTVPVTNFGNEYTAGQIKAGSKTANSATITGYRNSFYGTLTDTTELTSDVIRGLTKSGKAMANGGTMSISIPVGAKRVVFAYPSTLQDVTSVIDVSGMNADVSGAFKQITVSVEGANGYEAAEYKVYYTDYAEANDKANTYTVKI